MEGFCGNRSSEMVSNVASAVTTFLFNTIFMRVWDEDGVAAITIVLYFQFVFCTVDMGSSIVISFARTFVFLVGALLVLPQVWGRKRYY